MLASSGSDARSICGAQGGGRRMSGTWEQVPRAGGARDAGGPPSATRARPCSRSTLEERGPSRPRGAGERRARPRLLARVRDRHGRTRPGAVRAGRPATGGCSRAAALQYQPRPRELGTLKVLLTATNCVPTSDRRAGAQMDREGRLVMCTAPRFSRSAWSPRGTLGERSSASWYSTTCHRIAIAHGGARELGRPSAGRPRATRAQCGRFGPTDPLPL